MVAEIIEQQFNQGIFSVKPPVEVLRCSDQGRDVLIKLKRQTGMEHWNELCRIAYFYSLANVKKPVMYQPYGSVGLEIDWKVFSGNYSHELISLTLLRAAQHEINIEDVNEISEYFRAHLERGIRSLQGVSSLKELFSLCMQKTNNA